MKCAAFYHSNDVIRENLGWSQIILNNTWLDDADTEQFMSVVVFWTDAIFSQIVFLFHLQ